MAWVPPLGPPPRQSAPAVPIEYKRGMLYASDFDLDGDVDLMQLRAGLGYIVLENVKDFTHFDTEYDNDGLSDWQKLMDVDQETPGEQNPFDPRDADTTGDNGDPNPDGQND